MDAVIDRIAEWMTREASHGCLFHAAVAAAPHDARLRSLLRTHKAEVAVCAARVTGLRGREIELTLIIEGLTQSWPLHGDAASASAKCLSDALTKSEAATKTN